MHRIAGVSRIAIVSRCIQIAVYRGCPAGRYPVDMTTKGTPQRVIRVDDETWDAYGELCEEKGIARSAALRMFIKSEVAAWRKDQRDVDAARRIADS